LHQVRSYNRNLAINFWFNYDKIFHNSQFGPECSNNELDPTMTLDKFDYNNKIRDEISGIEEFRLVFLLNF
jgi:hypothetical protein